MSAILRWQTVKARKPHRCFGCGKTYPAGTLMISAAYADGGQAYGCYWCETCREYMQENFAYGDEVTQEGEIFDNDREGWEEIKAKQEATP